MPDGLDGGDLRRMAEVRADSVNYAPTPTSPSGTGRRNVAGGEASVTWGPVRSYFLKRDASPAPRDRVPRRSTTSWRAQSCKRGCPGTAQRGTRLSLKQWCRRGKDVVHADIGLETDAASADCSPPFPVETVKIHSLPPNKMNVGL